MIVRLVRTVSLLTVGLLGAYVAQRTVDGRRRERRLARPVTAWPDVALDEVVRPGRR